MTEIPEDVLIAAREHCENWGSLNQGDGAAKMVAAAIMAERKRCATIAEGTDTKKSSRGEWISHLIMEGYPSDFVMCKHGSITDQRDGEYVQFHLVLPQGDDREAYLDIAGSRFLLSELRHCIDTPYNLRRPEEGFKKLDDFTEGQIKALYPFALVLACLDGNAFVNLKNWDYDLVKYYVPDAYVALDSNGCVELTPDGAKFRSDRDD